jgi:hypothetical protein
MSEPRESSAAPSRQVFTGDGLAWLRDHPLDDTHAIVTSLPDASELPELSFDAWRAWFIDAAATACAATSPRAPTLFYQTDVKREGRWVDKGFLVSLGAERAGVSLLFHKIVCRVPPGQTTFGRPAYAHLLAFSRELLAPPADSTPDVVPRLGHMPWSRAMGTEACALSARFVRDRTTCRVVVDPFCGLGTMLAVANAHGLAAIGVELSNKRARRARNLVLPEHA